MAKNKKISSFMKSQILPTVIYCWTTGGKKPDLDKPHWSIDIDSNPYDMYVEYRKQFDELGCHGFTYYEAEQWLSEIIKK
ncbi:hypothetical protein CK510_09240 [Brunnivagina elsteri CCALA 953]|uniref:Uncharacterized protein n=2 Tax=Brunnivagina TaxID=3344733 RepID=A0A2A2TKN5_9CYAN|nr:hypothetical protein CK510_09240 [Calothrix elsteri CCALA 953]